MSEWSVRKTGKIYTILDSDGWISPICVMKGQFKRINAHQIIKEHNGYEAMKAANYRLAISVLQSDLYRQDPDVKKAVDIMIDLTKDYLEDD